MKVLGDTPELRELWGGTSYTAERMSTSYLSVYIEMALRSTTIPAARHS